MEVILINFSVELFWTLEKYLGYFLLPKYNLQSVT